MSDKYIAKEYSKLFGFKVANTYQLVKYPHNINFNIKTCVIKPTDLCDSHGIYFIKNNIDMKTKEKINKQKIIKSLHIIKSKIFNEYYMHENMYNGLIPFSGIIVEELLLDNGNIPKDYKCYVFGGKLYYIAVTSNRRIINGEQFFDSTWFDREWKPITYSMIKKGYKYKKLKKPFGFEKMVYLVENMGKILKRHCRIDVYLINDDVYLGEFTFFCGAKLHTLYCNYKLGNIWKNNPDNYSKTDEKLINLVPNFYNKPF